MLIFSGGLYVNRRWSRVFLFDVVMCMGMDVNKDRVGGLNGKERKYCLCFEGLRYVWFLRVMLYEVIISDMLINIWVFILG